MRITKKIIDSRFAYFCKLANIPTSATWDKEKREYSHQFLKVDHNSVYGGYRLDWVHIGTGESFFDSWSRMSSKEMFSYLNGLIKGIQLSKT